MIFKIFCFLFMQVFGNMFDILGEYNLSIPDLPPEFYTYLDMGFDYFLEGAGVFMYYFAGEYILVLFGISIVIMLIETIYLLVMWVIRKIPVPSE